ncbi:MAG: hypothetical protein H7A23_05575 [Leptospiraceae bacterium]|nr:hypothetical protein [Leptospiraceae bacterium]MCP5494007.1 hypothetical protein [Leptospiraceae bacterium]
MLTTVSFIDSLLSTFKLYQTEVNDFVKLWQEEEKGETNIECLFSTIIKYLFSRFLFSDVETIRLSRQKFITDITDEKLDEIRKTFINQVLYNDSIQNSQTIINWLENSFPELKVKLEFQKTEAKILPFGKKFTILFSFLIEIITNALKFSSGEEPIELKWYLEDDKYHFLCKNSFKTKKANFDSKKGLFFIESMTTHLKDTMSFEKVTKENTFFAEIKISKELF